MANKLARSKKIQEEQEALEKYDSCFKAKKRAKKQSKADVFDPFVYIPVKYNQYFIRNPQGWKPRVKSKKHDKIFLDAVRYLFQQYPVPPFLEKIWANKIEKNVQIVAFNGDTQKSINWIDWYLAVAQGKSFYKTCAKNVLTKREASTYINKAPREGNRHNNLWWTKAYCHTNNVDFANKIATSTLANHNIDEFYLSVMYFFAKEENRHVTRNDLNDYIDFIYYSVQGNPEFSLKGRTLHNLSLLRDEWHMELAENGRGGYKEWKGMLLPNNKYYKNKGENDEVVYEFKQILNSKDLRHEGKIMRNCVRAYMYSCENGTCSIWSMTKNNKKTLTIEVKYENQVVQVRAKANKTAEKGDARAVRQWAKDHNLKIHQFAF